MIKTIPKKRPHDWKFTGANTGAHSYYVCVECGAPGTREGVRAITADALSAEECEGKRK